MNSIETCLTPRLYPLHENREALVVLVDILRASSSICAAFARGVEAIIPVGTQEAALRLKESGVTLAAERDGAVLEFADFGNSPHEFTPERVRGQTIAYSTTNGTKALGLTQGCKGTVIGSFWNLSALSRELVEQGDDVLIFCAGWKGKFNLEDTLFAGALARNLLDTGRFETTDDATLAAMDLWGLAREDPAAYASKASWMGRLGLADVLQECFRVDVTKRVPRYLGDRIVCD